MIIEKANICDMEDILKIQKLAYISQAEIYNDYTLYPLVETVEQARDEFKKKTIFKAVVDGEVVGAVRALLHDGTCYIGMLCVHPKIQKHGIGTKLIRAVEDDFKEYKRFELFAGTKSFSNILLYEKLGYVKYKTGKYNENSEIVYLEKYTDK
jgi:ribosomal protein S18 acetylase RimI-like enzyme